MTVYSYSMIANGNNLHYISRRVSQEACRLLLTIYYTDSYTCFRFPSAETCDLAISWIVCAYFLLSGTFFTAVILSIIFKRLYSALINHFNVPRSTVIGEVIEKGHFHKEQLSKMSSRQTPTPNKAKTAANNQAPDSAKKEGINSLHLNKPNLEKQETGDGVVVTKNAKFAVVLHNTSAKVSLIKSDVFKSSAEFDEVCQQGHWVNAQFVKVSSSNLRYKYICVQASKLVDNVERRITRVKDGVVQLMINLESCTESNLVNYPDWLKIQSKDFPYGILVLRRHFKKLDLDKFHFIAYIPERLGCHFWIPAPGIDILNALSANDNANQRETNPKQITTNHNRKDDFERGPFSSEGVPRPKQQQFDKNSRNGSPGFIKKPTTQINSAVFMPKTRDPDPRLDALPKRGMTPLPENQTIPSRSREFRPVPNQCSSYYSARNSGFVGKSSTQLNARFMTETRGPGRLAPRINEIPISRPESNYAPSNYSEYRSGSASSRQWYSQEDLQSVSLPKMPGTGTASCASSSPVPRSYATTPTVAPIQRVEEVGMKVLLWWLMKIYHKLSQIYAFLTRDKTPEQAVTSPAPTPTQRTPRMPAERAIPEYIAKVYGTRIEMWNAVGMNLNCKQCKEPVSTNKDSYLLSHANTCNYAGLKLGRYECTKCEGETFLVRREATMHCKNKHSAGFIKDRFNEYREQLEEKCIELFAEE